MSEKQTPSKAKPERSKLTITILKKDLKPQIDELDLLLLGSKRTHSQRSEDNDVYNFDRHKLPPRSITRAVPAALIEDTKP